jgi:hypothetical protein
LKAVVLARLEADLDNAAASAASRWLGSELGARICRMERSAADPKEAGSRNAFLEALANASLPARRLELVRRLEAAVGGAEIDLDVAVQTTLGALLISASPTLTGTGSRLPDALQRQLEFQRLQLEPFIREAVVANNLYTYRSLGDEDLERFVRFAESSAGRRYYQVAGAALRDALVSAGVKLTAALSQTTRPALAGGEL